MQLVAYGFSKLIICKKKDVLIVMHLAKKARTSVRVGRLAELGGGGTDV